jgi:DNA polymerase-3 subunit gamma/tau
VSHLALARKHRPQRFAELVGQDAVRETLTRAVAGNRVAHAYLFAGPRGSGKTTTARLVAKALNCEERKPGEGEPCDRCRPCREIAAGTSMDVLEIDGASNRGIEEIRNLRENVKYAPTGGKFKVYIIDEAHQLTDHAWNALLKTLEEPPEHVRFVFATTQPLDVPDTIASRCQVFEFRRLRSEELVRHLNDVAAKEGVTLEPEAAELIARASEGSVRDALGRLDQALSLSPDGVAAEAVAQALGLAGLSAYFELGAAIAERDPGAALTVLDRLHDRGMDVEEIADGLTHHLRQLLLLAVDSSLEKILDASPSDRERYAAQAAAFRGTDLAAMLSLLLSTRGVLRRSEAPRILLEVALVELCTLPQASQVETLLRKLEALEARLGGSAAAPAPDAPPGGARARGREARGAGPAGGDPPGPMRFASGPAAPAARAEAPPPSPQATAPALESAPAGEESPGRWRDLVERVKERKLLLGTCLEEGTFLGVSQGKARVALSPEHAFHRAMLEMKENRAILNEELERSFGRGAALLCEIATGGAAARRPMTAADPAAPQRAPGSAEPAPGVDAGGAGMVRRIVELFDGEIQNPGPEGSGA